MRCQKTGKYVLTEWNKNDSRLLQATDKAGYHEVELLLLKKGVDPTKLDPTKGITSLHLAASKGLLEIVKLFLTHDVDADARDLRGRTALHCAVRYARYDVTEFLLQNEASVLIVDHDYFSVLHHACFGGHLDCIKLLLSAKAPVYLKDKFGRCPLAYAASRGQASVCRLLLEHGADIDNTGNNKITPLMLAAANGSTAVCDYLISRSANILLTDVEGRNALWFAKFHNHPDVAKLLEHATKLFRAQSQTVSQPSQSERENTTTTLKTLYEEHPDELNDESTNARDPYETCSQENDVVGPAHTAEANGSVDDTLKMVGKTNGHISPTNDSPTNDSKQVNGIAQSETLELPQRRRLKQVENGLPGPAHQARESISSIDVILSQNNDVIGEILAHDVTGNELARDFETDAAEVEDGVTVLYRNNQQQQQQQPQQHQQDHLPTMSVSIVDKQNVEAKCYETLQFSHRWLTRQLRQIHDALKRLCIDLSVIVQDQDHEQDNSISSSQATSVSAGSQPSLRATSDHSASPRARTPSFPSVKSLHECCRSRAIQIEKHLDFLLNFDAESLAEIEISTAALSDAEIDRVLDGDRSAVDRVSGLNRLMSENLKLREQLAEFTKENGELKIQMDGVENLIAVATDLKRENELLIVDYNRFKQSVYEENVEQEDLENFMKDTIEELNRLRLRNNELEQLSIARRETQQKYSSTENETVRGDNSIDSMPATNAKDGAVKTDVVTNRKELPENTSSHNARSKQQQSEIEEISKEFKLVLNENAKMREIVKSLRTQNADIPKLRERIRYLTDKISPETGKLGRLLQECESLQNSSESSDFEEFGQEVINPIKEPPTPARRQRTDEPVNIQVTDSCYQENALLNIKNEASLLMVTKSPDTGQGMTVKSPNAIGKVSEGTGISAEVKYDWLDSETPSEDRATPIPSEVVHSNYIAAVREENENLRSRIKELQQEIGALERTVKEQSHYLSQCRLDASSGRFFASYNSLIPDDSSKFRENCERDFERGQARFSSTLKRETQTGEKHHNLQSGDTGYFTASHDQQQDAQGSPEGNLLQENIRLRSEYAKARTELAQSLHANQSMSDYLKEFRGLLNESSILLEISSDVLNEYAVLTMEAAQAGAVGGDSRSHESTGERLTEAYIEGRYAKLSGWLENFARLRAEHKQLIRVYAASDCSANLSRESEHQRSNGELQFRDPPEERVIRTDSAATTASSLADKETASLRQPVDILSSAETFSKSDASGLAQDEDNSRKVIETLTSENKSFREKVNSLMAENETLRQLLESKSPQMSVDYEEQLMTEIDDLARQRKLLQAELRERDYQLEELRVELSEENAYLRKKLDSIGTKRPLDDILSDHELLTAENERLRAELRQLERDMLDLERSISVHPNSFKIKNVDCIRQETQMRDDIEVNCKDEAMKSMQGVLEENERLRNILEETTKELYACRQNLNRTERESVLNGMTKEGNDYRNTRTVEGREDQIRSDTVRDKSVDQIGEDDFHAGVETIIERLRQKNAELMNEVFRLRYILELEMLKNFPKDGGAVTEIRVVRCVSDTKQAGPQAADVVDGPVGCTLIHDGVGTLELIESHARLVQENDSLRARLHENRTVAVQRAMSKNTATQVDPNDVICNSADPTMTHRLNTHAVVTTCAVPECLEADDECCSHHREIEGLRQINENLLYQVTELHRRLSNMNTTATEGDRQAGLNKDGIMVNGTACDQSPGQGYLNERSVSSSSADMEEQVALLKEELQRLEIVKDRLQEENSVLRTWKQLHNLQPRSLAHQLRAENGKLRDFVNMLEEQVEKRSLSCTSPSGSFPSGSPHSPNVHSPKRAHSNCDETDFMQSGNPLGAELTGRDKRRRSEEQLRSDERLTDPERQLIATRRLLQENEAKYKDLIYNYRRHLLSAIQGRLEPEVKAALLNIVQTKK